MKPMAKEMAALSSLFRHFSMQRLLFILTLFARFSHGFTRSNVLLRTSSAMNQPLPLTLKMVENTSNAFDTVAAEGEASTTSTTVPRDYLVGTVVAVILLAAWSSLPEITQAQLLPPASMGQIHHSSPDLLSVNQILSSADSMISSTTMPTSAATVPAEAVDWQSILQKAGKKAVGGGKAGALAAAVQVLSLMWLRTSMNRQYRYGGNLQSSLKALWEEGGIPRLYQGLPFALIQGPLTRFGDTAANVGILALLESTPETQALPLPLKTLAGSIAAGTWRIVLMPIDASKTAMQVEGADGLQNLWGLAAKEGPGVMYQGALAQAAATVVGHFPWFVTYNFLNDQLPAVSASEDLLLSLARSALLGLCASCVSDVCSNSLRVIKTTKQTARLGKSETGEIAKGQSYAEIVKLIVEQDGIQGLLGRGLQTRLLTNAIQGAVFSVLWRYFQQAGA